MFVYEGKPLNFPLLSQIKGGRDVASAQVMNINGLSACTNESAGEAESPDIRVSAAGGDQEDS